MKMLMSALVLSLSLTACVKSASDLPNFGFAPGPDSGATAYSDEPLSGTVFGMKWEAKTAVARPFGTDGTQLSIWLYSEILENACSNSFSSKTYATLVIPANYQIMEYIADLRDMSGNGELLVFTRPPSDNIFSEQTKLRINSISETGFEASLYAYGFETSAAKSEMNGTVTVTDCTK